MSEWRNGAILPVWGMMGEQVVGVETEEIGAALKLRRRQLGLRQSDLADLSGVSERFIRDAEQGKATMRLDKLVTICTTLGLRLTLESM